MNIRYEFPVNYNSFPLWMLVYGFFLWHASSSCIFTVHLVSWESCNEQHIEYKRLCARSELARHLRRLASWCQSRVYTKLNMFQSHLDLCQVSMLEKWKPHPYLEIMHSNRLTSPVVAGLAHPNDIRSPHITAFEGHQKCVKPPPPVSKPSFSALCPWSAELLYFKYAVIVQSALVFWCPLHIWFCLHNLTCPTSHLHVRVVSVARHTEDSRVSELY